MKGASRKERIRSLWLMVSAADSRPVHRRCWSARLLLLLLTSAPPAGAVLTCISTERSVSLLCGCSAYQGSRQLALFTSPGQPSFVAVCSASRCLSSRSSFVFSCSLLLFLSSSMLPSAVFRRRAGGGVDNGEAERRIQKMIAFILNDALEKAEEIALQAEREAHELRRSIAREQESAQPVSHQPLVALTVCCAQLLLPACFSLCRLLLAERRYAGSTRTRGGGCGQCMKRPLSRPTAAAC
jgi:hypothetical protein